MTITQYTVALSSTIFSDSVLTLFEPSQTNLLSLVTNGLTLSALSLSVSSTVQSVHMRYIYCYARCRQQQLMQPMRTSC